MKKLNRKQMVEIKGGFLPSIVTLTQIAYGLMVNSILQAQGVRKI
jgi:hypothetical protein